MKSVVFFNNKGGVGKTTLLCNLGAYLAIEKNKKILVVDADPQCNTTTYAVFDDRLEEAYSKSKRETVESFLNPIRRGKGYLQERIEPEKSTRFGFDLILGDPRLALSEDLLAADWQGATTGDARGLQTTLVFQHLCILYDDYDYIFFDVGPSLGAINRSIMIASDYFVIPMSVDVFSLMALENMKLSLNKWRDGIERGLLEYEDEEGEGYEINGNKIGWNLQFAGYVMQQYKAKTIKGNRVHVNSYEKISKLIPEKVSKEISANFPCEQNGFVEKLGEVENLHSLVPMSQMAKAPIFSLKAADGVVGYHFSKVSEAGVVFGGICDKLLSNLGDEND